MTPVHRAVSVAWTKVDADQRSPAVKPVMVAVETATVGLNGSNAIRVEPESAYARVMSDMATLSFGQVDSVRVSRLIDCRVRSGSDQGFARSLRSRRQIVPGDASAQKSQLRFFAVPRRRARYLLCDKHCGQDPGATRASGLRATDASETSHFQWTGGQTIFFKSDGTNGRLTEFCSVWAATDFGRVRLSLKEVAPLIGIVSIGDIVKHRLREMEREQSALRDYIQTA